MSILQNQTVLTVSEELLKSKEPLPLGIWITIVLVPEHLIKQFKTSDLYVALLPILSSNQNSRVISVSNFRWDPKIIKQ